MKRKLTFLTVVWLFVSLLVFAGVAIADYAWRNCTVVEAGLSDTGDYTILLERNNGKQQSFVIPNAQLNKILALSMTAMQNGLQTRAYVDWTHATGDTIDGLIIVTGN